MPGSNPCPICVELGFSRHTEELDGFRISQEQHVQIPLQEKYSIDNIQCMQKGFEILHKTLKDKPNEILKMFQLITDFKIDKVHKIIQELNLKESFFHLERGGLIALFAALVISESANK